MPRPRAHKITQSTAREKPSIAKIRRALSRIRDTRPRDAQAHDLWACARGVARLADAARSGKAVRDELSGSTITLSSLGRLGGIVSTPVINHPEVAIVGVNRIVERPVIRAGAVVARQMMNLSSSFDHRVVDGMIAATFVQCLRELLELPATLFVE